jgi:hypothetical protein
VLKDVFLVPHAHVQDDVARRPAGLGLKAHAHPAVRVVGALESLGGDGVGEREKHRPISTGEGEAFEQQVVLVIEHQAEPLA